MIPLVLFLHHTRIVVLTVLAFFSWYVSGRISFFFSQYVTGVTFFFFFDIFFYLFFLPFLFYFFFFFEKELRDVDMRLYFARYATYFDVCIRMCTVQTSFVPDLFGFSARIEMMTF